MANDEVQNFDPEPEPESSEVADESQVVEETDAIDAELAEMLEDKPADDGSDAVAAIAAERDSYMEASRRVQAEFENYRKQAAKRETDNRARANESLVSELLPVLDACDAAIENGSEEVSPINTALFGALQKQGLVKIDPAGEAFDPEQHEAVMHADGAGDGGPVVSEVLRPGYEWKGRVIRPAMVQVEG